MPGNSKLQISVFSTKTISQQIQRSRSESLLRPVDNASMPTMRPQRILCRDDETAEMLMSDRMEWHHNATQYILFDAEFKYLASKITTLCIYYLLLHYFKKNKNQKSSTRHIHAQRIQSRQVNRS